MLQDGIGLRGRQLMAGRIGSSIERAVVGVTFDRNSLPLVIGCDNLSDSIEDPRSRGGELGSSRLKELVGRNTNPNDPIVFFHGQPQLTERSAADSSAGVRRQFRATTSLLRRFHALESVRQSTRLLARLSIGHARVLQLIVDLGKLSLHEVRSLFVQLHLLLRLGKLRSELSIVLVEQLGPPFDLRHLRGELLLHFGRNGLISGKREARGAGREVRIASVATGETKERCPTQRKQNAPAGNAGALCVVLAVRFDLGTHE